MKKDIKQKWIDALKSGRYKQGQGRLKSCNDEFCCLGVLCDSIDSEGWNSPTTFKYNNVLSSFYLPIELRVELELTFADQQKLTDMNDEEHLSFEQIADWIEENL